MIRNRIPLCPRCGKAPVDTVANAPYIRGFVLAYNYGMKQFVGCRACVRKQLAGEVGTSLLTGWFSLTSIVVNPVCILWNGLRVPFLKPDPETVEKMLQEIGVGPAKVDLPRIAASLAASMVAADGDIDSAEVRTAIAIGCQLIDGFQPRLFHDVLENVRRLPPVPQQASLLVDVLEDDGKVAILKYLLAIAAADGRIDDAEIAQLQATASALGIVLPDLEDGD